MKWALVVLLFAGVAVDVMAAGGTSTGGVSTTPTRAEKSPTEKAAQRYDSGLKNRDKANKAWEKAQAQTGKKRDKLLRKADKQYKKAIKKFQAAIELRPGFYQAHSSLGFAYRRIGEFDQSLSAYNEALSLNPEYGEAIEYRAEAYLGLNRIDEAKQAYMELFGRDRSLADQLMIAMYRWVAERRSQSLDGEQAIGSGRVEAFAQWLAEREEIASQTVSLNVGSDPW